MSKKNRSVSDEELGKVSGGDMFYDKDTRLWYLQDQYGEILYHFPGCLPVKEWAKSQGISTDEISPEKGWERFEDFLHRKNRKR